MTLQTQTMLAALWTANNTKAVLDHVPVPTPRQGEVLLKVLACGVCHTDAMLLDTNCQGFYQDEKFPLGHEVCAQVVANGPNATAVVGQRYSVHCVQGRPAYYGPQILQFDRAVGIGRVGGGGYAEYIVAPEIALVPVPDAVSHQLAAAASCAGVTAYNAVYGVGQVKASDRVLILGAGGLGKLAVQMCLLIGAKEIGVCDISRAALQSSETYWSGSPRTSKFRTFTPEELAAEPFTADVVLDFVGATSTIEAAFAALRPVATVWPNYGRLVLVGVGDGELKIPVVLLQLFPVRILPISNGSLEHLAAVLQLFAENKLQMETDIRPLEDVNAALDDVRASKVTARIVLVPSSTAA